MSKNGYLFRSLETCLEKRVEFVHDLDLFNELSHWNETSRKFLYCLLTGDLISLVLNYFDVPRLQQMIPFLSGLHSREHERILVIWDALSLLSQWFPDDLLYANLEKIPAFRNMTGVDRPHSCFAQLSEMEVWITIPVASHMRMSLGSISQESVTIFSLYVGVTIQPGTV